MLIEDSCCCPECGSIEFTDERDEWGFWYYVCDACGHNWSDDDDDEEVGDDEGPEPWEM